MGKYQNISITHTAILITNGFFRWLAFLSLISEALVSFLGGRLVRELLLDELQNFHTCRNSAVYHITFVTQFFLLSSKTAPNLS